MRRKLVVTGSVLVLLASCLLCCGTGGWWATRDVGPMSDDEARAAFEANRARLDALHARFEHDAHIEEIRTDAYSWTDGCNVAPAGAGACRDRVAPTSGRPPGLAEQPCAWGAGCLRWVDERPTPAIVAGIWSIPEPRAAEYLDDLDALGASGIVRRRGLVHVTLDTWGIVTSGGEITLLHTTTPPSPLVSSLVSARLGATDGEAYVPLGGDWYLASTWN